MYKKILLVVFSFLPCLVFSKSDLSKQEKAIVKALKKQYKLKDVEIERPYNGFVYYNLLTKDFRRMIADSTGQIIIPQSKLVSEACPNNIRFVKGHTKGLSNFREKGRNARTITAYYPGNESVFIASKSIGGGSNEYKFYSTVGEWLASFDGYLNENFNSPVYISKDLLGNYGLIAMDGRILLSNEYTAIEARADGICVLSQMNDGIERMGGTCISELTDMSVPCIFNYVDYSQSKKCWLVQIHEYDSIQAYKENYEYDTKFLDEGQRLFEQQQYEDARKYYTLTGNEAKWAQFYIGATYYKSIVVMFQNMNDDLAILENSSNRQDRNIAANIHKNLAVYTEENRKAEEAFSTYLESNHEKYAAKAKEMLYELSELKSRVAGMEGRVSMAVADLERRCEELDRIEQEKYNRNMEQQRLNLEQQRLNEQRLAREQRDREIRMRQKADMERKHREVKRRVEEKRKAQLRQQQNQQQQPNSQLQRRNQQQIQRKELEKGSRVLNGPSTTPIYPKKKTNDNRRP